MRKSRVFLVIAFLTLTFGLGIMAPGADTQAASLKNVLKAPQAEAGKWVAAKKGYRYRVDGKLVKSAWLRIDGKVYYFKSDGYLQTGWKKYAGRKYYFNKQGALVYGCWKKVGSAKYYLSGSTGAAYLGKKKIGGSYYYFDKTTGKMLTGWQKIGGIYYYFNKSTGKMAVSQKVGKYRVDEQGRRVSSNPAVTPQELPSEKEIIFVGDSRTVGMCAAVHSNCQTCIGEVGQGYSWLVSTAIPRLKNQLKKTPSAAVVFNLGVNDIENHAKYISKYKSLIKSYPKADFYFMSVNPIAKKLYNAYGYAYGYTKMNKLIKTFNKEMKAAFPDKYIDTYTYLKKEGFSTGDGLHYTAATYKKIYDYTVSQITE